MKSYLKFKINKETYAIDVSNVFNILEVPKITKVPRSPDYMLGLFNFRGQVFPIIDSRLKLKIEDNIFDKHTSVLAIEFNDEEEKIKLGLLVDKVDEVIEIEESDILPKPNIGSNFESDFITGTYKIDDEFVMIIDIKQFIIK